MMGLAHVLLHVGLCSAVARLGPQTTVPIRVRLALPTQPPSFDQTFRVQRGYGTDVPVEFDIGRGTYRLVVDVPKYNCSVIDYLDIIPDHSRTIVETLVDGIAPNRPMTMFEGTTPSSFTYAKPTFVFLDPGVKCGQPVGDPLPANVVTENERDGYYVSVYFDQALAARKPVVALRLRTATGLEHFVRIRIPWMFDWGGFANNAQLNITDDILDTIVGEKPDVLLCPPVWQSRVSSGAIPHAVPLPSASPASSAPAKAPAPAPSVATPAAGAQPAASAEPSPQPTL